MRAYCWRGGVIEFGRKTPKGAIQIARGKARKVREAVSALARHAYDGKTLLVPGIPEAASDDQAADALEQFLRHLAPALARRAA